jgi:hypothetical protein
MLLRCCVCVWGGGGGCTARRKRLLRFCVCRGFMCSKAQGTSFLCVEGVYIQQGARDFMCVCGGQALKRRLGLGRDLPESFIQTCAQVAMEVKF